MLDSSFCTSYNLPTPSPSTPVERVFALDPATAASLYVRYATTFLSPTGDSFNLRSLPDTGATQKCIYIPLSVAKCLVDTGYASIDKNYIYKPII